MHVSPPSKFFPVLTLVLLMFIPVVMLHFLHPYLSILSISAISLSLVLLLVTVLDFVTKKDILALLFGCHQHKTKSIKIKSYIFPICARCTGIYFGVFIFTIMLIFIKLPWYLSVIFALPLIIDGLLQQYKHFQSTQFRRLLSGFLFSFTFIYVFYLYQYAMLSLGQWIASLIQ